MKARAKPGKSKLPYVLSNFAMTADGKISFAGGRFVPFGSARDREHMMELRAGTDAILCGARTVEATGTILGNGGEKFRRRRRKHGLAEYAVRVIASGSGSINPRAAVFGERFSPILILTTAAISKARLGRLRAVADEVRIFGRREIRFRAALGWLRAEWGVRRLLCEGGGELNWALLRAGLVDELHLTICPKVFGGSSAPTIADGRGFARLAGAIPLKLKSCRRAGGELFAVFIRAPKR